MARRMYAPERIINKLTKKSLNRIMSPIQRSRPLLSQMRDTKVRICCVGGEGGIPSPPRFGCSPSRTRCNPRALYSSRSNCPPKPATLTVIRFAHFSSRGGVRIGFKSHVLFSLFLLSRYTKYDIRYTIRGGRSCNQFEPLVKLLHISRSFLPASPIYIRNYPKKQPNSVYWE